MLDEPYRWVEAIRNRREYLEDQLKSASPVVAQQYENGILLLTSTPGPRKIFEIYNQIAFAAVGHPTDIEKLRKAIIDIAHVEAFNLSARDVSLHRLVSFGIGPMMKTAFDEIFRSPYIARVLVAQLDANDDDETFYTIDEDGSFSCAGEMATVGGGADSKKVIMESASFDNNQTLEQALDRAIRAWAVGRLYSEGREPDNAPTNEEILERITKTLDSHQRFDAALLDRSLPKKTKFRLLPKVELDGALERLRT